MKRTMLAACAALAAAATLAAPASAGTEDLIGTWECRIPGAEPTRTPPIVWFGAARADGKVVQTTVDLDGFARTVAGLSDVSADADGWLRVQPESGPAFAVKPLGAANKQRIPAMSLKRAGATYRCLRLPASA